MQKQQNDNVVLIVEFDKKVDSDLLAKIKGVHQVKNKQENRWVFVVQSDAIRNEIFQFAVKNELVVLTMQKENRNLEDIFKELTT